MGPPTGALALSPEYPTPQTHLSAVCCQINAGTRVAVELVSEITTRAYKRGESFTLRLMAPIIVDGQVVVEAGALGAGTVIDASRPGIGGKPAKIVLAADYLVAGDTRLALDDLQLAAHGHDNSTPAMLLEIGGIVSAPAGVAGIVLPGTNAGFKAGTIATARVASDVVLPRLRNATEADLAAVAKSSSISSHEDASGVTSAAIHIPPPPAGKGQVVFFRAKTLLGTAQWFRVREHGKALGKLGNGAYFIRSEEPGVHTFTDKLEPELKDRLTLQIDPGQTYFVEGTLTSGLVLSAADLEPSTVEKFNKAIKSLKLAAASQRQP